MGGSLFPKGFPLGEGAFGKLPPDVSHGTKGGGRPNSINVFRKFRFQSRAQLQAAKAHSHDMVQVFSETTLADAATAMMTTGLAASRFARPHARNLQQHGLAELDFIVSEASASRRGSCTEKESCQPLLLSMPVCGNICGNHLLPCEVDPARARLSLESRLAGIRGRRAEMKSAASVRQSLDKRGRLANLAFLPKSSSHGSLARLGALASQKSPPLPEGDGPTNASRMEHVWRKMPHVGEIQVLLRPAGIVKPFSILEDRIPRMSSKEKDFFSANAPVTPPRHSETVRTTADVDSPTVAVPQQQLVVRLPVTQPEAPALEGPVMSESLAPARPPGIRMFSWSRLEMKQKLGSGAFSNVHLAVLKGAHGQSSTNVAVKMNISGSSSTLIKEAKMICHLRHPNLVKVYGVSTEPMALISEVVPNGTLSSFLRARGEMPLPIQKAHVILKGIAEGLQFLHTQQPPVVHRDLSSNNVLLDRLWRPRIGDFGLSRWQKNSCISNSSAGPGLGTPNYMAPEVLSNGKITEKADVFSFGVLVWEVLTGREPWQDLNPFQVIYQVCFGNKQLELPGDCPAPLAGLMHACWSKSPEARPQWPAVLQALDDWIAGEHVEGDMRRTQQVLVAA